MVMKTGFIKNNKSCLELDHLKKKKREGLCIHKLEQSGNFSGSGFFMDNAFFGCFVKGGLIFSQDFIRIFTTSFFYSSKLFFQGFESGFGGSVSKPFSLTLFCAFDCRFMVCQLNLSPL
jgi:hypothetical protein